MKSIKYTKLVLAFYKHIDIFIGLWIEFRDSVGVQCGCILIYAITDHSHINIYPFVFKTHPCERALHP